MNRAPAKHEILQWLTLWAGGMKFKPLPRNEVVGSKAWDCSLIKPTVLESFDRPRIKHSMHFYALFEVCFGQPQFIDQES
jgi:hypothetical protein